MSDQTQTNCTIVYAAIQCGDGLPDTVASVGYRHELPKVLGRADTLGCPVFAFAEPAEPSEEDSVLSYEMVDSWRDAASARADLGVRAS